VCVRATSVVEGEGGGSKCKKKKTIVEKEVFK
jgi:hypothetical protein